jgi:hypothetical protein
LLVAKAKRVYDELLLSVESRSLLTPLMDGREFCCS